MMDLTKLKPPQITFYCSAFSVLITLHLTIQLVSQHLFHWKNPKEQKANCSHGSYLRSCFLCWFVRCQRK
ncbi:unnamed protein product [Brassica oleracea var. botrytis]|uniref:Uncharacterized protein n=1 Tax=Brassica oleracea TaxID=3712 RepID=A0A3P6B3L5_BRAOL|nr:unnamed protein product [Brassica oleracea]